MSSTNMTQPETTPPLLPQKSALRRSTSMRERPTAVSAPNTPTFVSSPQLSRSSSVRSNMESYSLGHTIARKMEDIIVPGPPMRDVWLKAERKKNKRDSIRSSILWPTKLFTKTPEKRQISEPFNVNHVLHVDVDDFFNNKVDERAKLKKKTIDVDKYRQRKLPPTPLILTPPGSPGRVGDRRSLPPSPTPLTPGSNYSPSAIMPPSWANNPRDSSQSLGRSSSLSRSSSIRRKLQKFQQKKEEAAIEPKCGPQRPQRPEFSWLDDDGDVLEHIVDSYYRRASITYADVNAQKRQISTNNDRSRRPSAVTFYDSDLEECGTEDHDIKNLPITMLPTPSARQSFESDYSSASSISSLQSNSPTPLPRAQRNWLVPPRSQSLRYSAKNSKMHHERKISEEPDDWAAYELRQSARLNAKGVSMEIHNGFESPVLGAGFI